MKYPKSLRILGIAVVLSLLLMLIPLSPALAAYDTVLTPAQAKIGDQVTVKGTNFPTSTTTTEKWATIYLAKDDTAVGAVAKYIDTDVKTYKNIGSAIIGYLDDPDEGEFTKTFNIPTSLVDGTEDATVAPGTYYIYITITTAELLIKSKATFIVVGGGAVTLDVTSGKVGSELGINGSDFSPNQDLIVKYDGTTVNIEDGDTGTDASGVFYTIVSIPQSYAGSHAVSATVGTTVVSSNFTVIPDIKIGPLSGPVGASVSINGTGFARRPKTVTVYFNNNAVTTVTPDTKGTFAASFLIPAGAPAGVRTIEAEDQDQNSVSANFTVASGTTTPPPATTNVTPTPPPTPTPTPPPAPKTTLNLSQKTGAVGTNVVVGGAGFKANGAITIKFNDKQISTATADATGLFLATFKIPTSTHGSNNITVSDGTSTNNVTFAVESVAPQTPTPLLPEMGVKAKSPVHFDWEDVTDDSAPVTYNLQIATRDTFTASSLVLEKKGLTESKYTLTEDESADLPASDKPYFWQVKAVDGAANESGWTGLGEFSIGKPFSFSGWPMYVAIVVGAIVLLLVGILIGRKSAYSY